MGLAPFPRNTPVSWSLLHYLSFMEKFFKNNAFDHRTIRQWLARNVLQALQEKDVMDTVGWFSEQTVQFICKWRKTPVVEEDFVVGLVLAAVGVVEAVVGVVVEAGMHVVWVPVTKLGCLVKDMKIKTLEEIYLFSLPIKESEIIDFFLGSALKDEVLKIMPVQKQTRAGQRTRFKAFVAIGDYNGHVGLGVKCSKEVATAIRGAIILAKLSIIPVRRGYWGNKIEKPHTVPCKMTGQCGSVLVRLICGKLRIPVWTCPSADCSCGSPTDPCIKAIGGTAPPSVSRMLCRGLLLVIKAYRSPPVSESD
ncbi:uncharacterized protein [Hemitrygon akajei]|uniref:uncharacterized protein n=1 Tax=Hemitrygon akajei TaxID=2704970 RepID=UPI003BF9B542